MYMLLNIKKKLLLHSLYTSYGIVKQCIILKTYQVATKNIKIKFFLKIFNKCISTFDTNTLVYVNLSCAHHMVKFVTMHVYLHTSNTIQGQTTTHNTP